MTYSDNSTDLEPYRMVQACGCCPGSQGQGSEREAT